MPNYRGPENFEELPLNPSHLIVIRKSGKELS
jgi:hypothetical protein